jgi:hypothetical protein
VNSLLGLSSKDSLYSRCPLRRACWNCIFQPCSGKFWSSFSTRVSCLVYKNKYQNLEGGIYEQYIAPWCYTDHFFLCIPGWSRNANPKLLTVLWMLASSSLGEHSCWLPFNSFFCAVQCSFKSQPNINPCLTFIKTKGTKFFMLVREVEPVRERRQWSGRDW